MFTYVCEIIIVIVIIIIRGSSLDTVKALFFQDHSMYRHGFASEELYFDRHKSLFRCKCVNVLIMEMYVFSEYRPAVFPTLRTEQKSFLNSIQQHLPNLWGDP